MKRFLALAAVACLASCSFDDKPTGSGGKVSAVLTQDQAMKLASRGNCLACHKLDGEMTGPAWREIGIRYGSDPKAAPAIATHIRNGGSFGWNMGFMPMRGGGSLSDQEIDALAQYIATLR